MVSIAIFLIMLTFVLPLFVRMDEERRDRMFHEDMQMKLAFTTDYILKTEGGWDPNVSAVGLADADGKINTTKLRKLMKVDRSRAKELLGLSGFEFNLSFYSSGYPAMTGVVASPAAYFFDSSSALFSEINGSGLVWDSYSTASVASDSRNSYTGSKIDVFNSLLANASAYRTIVIEDPGLTQAQVDVAALKDFVSSGGVLVFFGSADLISSGFSMSSGQQSGTGYVADNSLIDAPLGSAAVLNSNWYFYHANGDAALHIIINSTDGAYVGLWNHGVGEIFYINDVNGAVDGIRVSSGFLGSRAEYSTGSMNEKAVSSRAVVFDSELNSMGMAVMVIGK